MSPKLKRRLKATIGRLEDGVKWLENRVGELEQTTDVLAQRYSRGNHLKRAMRHSAGRIPPPALVKWWYRLLLLKDVQLELENGEARHERGPSRDFMVRTTTTKPPPPCRRIAARQPTVAPLAHHPLTRRIANASMGEPLAQGRLRSEYMNDMTLRTSRYYKQTGKEWTGEAYDDAQAAASKLPSLNDILDMRINQVGLNLSGAKNRIDAQAEQMRLVVGENKKMDWNADLAERLQLSSGALLDRPQGKSWGQPLLQ